MKPEAAFAANEAIESLEKFGPVAAALLATLGIAYISYMLYCEWKQRKIRLLEQRIAELEDENTFLRERLEQKDEQLNKALSQQCEIAFQANNSDKQAENHRKRAEKMAEEAEKYRRMAGVPAA